MKLENEVRAPNQYPRPPQGMMIQHYLNEPLQHYISQIAEFPFQNK